MAGRRAGTFLPTSPAWCMVHGAVAAAHAAGVYRQSDPAVEAEAKPLQWLEYGFLARGKATESKIAHVTSTLRGLLRDSELKKSVVGDLARNTLAATLLSEDISSYQTATLMGWSLGAAGEGIIKCVTLEMIDFS